MPSLQDAINAAGGPLALLRSGSGGFPLPIKSEFTNWRDEQESWRTTAALMDLSHHMNDLTVEGPDTYQLLADLGANSFKGFGPMKAKQFVTVSYDGYIIGDAILFGLGENLVRLVGRPPALNWVQYHAETGPYDVTVRLDPRTANNPKGRELFRLQLQGPFAGEIFEQAKVDCRVLSITTEMFGQAAHRPPYSVMQSQREHAIRLPSWHDGLAGYLAQREAEKNQ